MTDDEEIGDFLLLLRTLADEEDMEKRQSMLLAIEWRPRNLRRHPFVCI